MGCPIPKLGNVMSFYLPQFSDLIKRIILAQDLYSDAALNLLLGTSAQESFFGTCIRQLGGGPALGVFQMEPKTELDTWENYLSTRYYRRTAMVKICGVFSYYNSGAMEWNLAYQTCMARLHYRRIPEPFPKSDDIEGLGRYWDTHWNRNPEKGTVKEFVQNYRKYIKK